MEIFFNTKKCIDYIKSLSDDTRIFLISSSSDTETIVKVHGTYSDLQSLSNQLSQEYKRCKYDSQMSISIFFRDENEKTVRDLNKENSRFLWLQLLVDILIQIPYNDQIQRGKKVHRRISKSSRRLTNLLKPYYFIQKIHFYFVYSIDHFEPKILIFYSYFVFFWPICIINYVQKLYSEQFSINPKYTGKTLILYRGQNMKISEFNHIKGNVGGLLSVNTFFSTTDDLEVAIVFSGFDDKDRLPELISVVFKIEIDLTHPVINKPFASIEHLSRFSDEYEVLFSVGSIFRILNVQYIQISEGYWHVKMKLVDDDNDINELRTELESEYCHKSNMCKLGNALITMDDYKRAERYFRMLLEYLSESHSSVGSIHGSLGSICSKRGNYQAALEYFQKTLHIEEEILKKKTKYHPLLATVCNNVGEIYTHLGDDENAFKYLQHALDIRLKGTVSTHTDLAAIYNNLGRIY